MSPFIILCVQSTLSIVVFAFIASWYVKPHLDKLSLPESLLPLLFVHAFRFAPLALLLPEINTSAVPAGVLETVAYGDFLAGMLAIVSILFIKYKMTGAMVVTWVFSVVGILDIINALRLGVGSALYNYPIGFGWYILNFYLPVVVVTHLMIVSRLIKIAKT